MADENPAAVIARDLRALPEETRKALKPKLREAGRIIGEEAKRRAGWSSRIPGTVRVRVNDQNVKIYAGGPSAPHARPYENLGAQGIFRHPVYGNWDNWVPQEARPFLFPSAEAKQGEATAVVFTALDDAAAALGFS